jgi:hypothetical protein
MTSQRVQAWLARLCGPALLGLALLAGAGCEGLANPTKGPEYEKGYAIGAQTAQRMGKKWGSGPAPTPPRGKSEEWKRGYQEGWKAIVRSAK